MIMIKKGKKVLFSIYIDDKNSKLFKNKTKNNHNFDSSTQANNL